jgi:hypothetical protein
VPRRDQRILLGLTALSVLLALLVSLTGVNADVLLATPALVLLLPLLAGRYVGEDGIARLGARLDEARRRPARAGLGAPLRAPSVLPRGGRLIAAGLAERGPPAAPLAARS